MTTQEATQYLAANPNGRVSYQSRDATGMHWVTVECRLDARLVQPHPTDSDRPEIPAPSDVEFTVVDPRELAERRRHHDYLRDLDIRERPVGRRGGS